MDQKYSNLLTKYEYMRIVSERTGKLYLDMNYNTYLFDSPREANQFCEEVGLVKPFEAEFIRQAQYCSACYGIGAEGIRVKLAKEEKFQTIPVLKTDAKRQYYNVEADRNIARLLQTSKKKYMIGLRDCKFLSPILITSRKEQKHPSMHYGIARVPDGPSFHILFTTIHEFDEWNKKVNEVYSPNETNLLEFRTIRGNNPLIINPETDKLILTDKQIEEILHAER